MLSKVNQCNGKYIRLQLRILHIYNQEYRFKNICTFSPFESYAYVSLKAAIENKAPDTLLFLRPNLLLKRP